MQLTSIHRAGKPLLQRNGRILEYRSDFYGELLAARATLPAFLSRQIVRLFGLAVRAFRAIGPAQGSDSINADLFVGKDESLAVMSLGFPCSECNRNFWVSQVNYYQYKVGSLPAKTTSNVLYWNHKNQEQARASYAPAYSFAAIVPVWMS